MKRLILLLSFILISGSVVMSQTLATDIFSEGNMNLPAVGSEFNVPINAIDFPDELRYVEFFFQYDPNVLTFIGFENPQHPPTQVTVWVNNPSQPAPNVIKVTYTALPIPPASFNIEEPKLLDFKFEYLGGDCDLMFLEVFNGVKTRYRVVNTITPITSFEHGAIIGAFVNVVTIKDGAWEDPSTWQYGVVPEGTHNVSILHEVTIDSDAVCNDLTIGTTGRLTLNDGGNITPGGNVLIDSDITGTGSFVNNGDPIVINGTVKQYMTGQTDDGELVWHLVSVPVESIWSADVFFGCHLQTWEETISLWEDVQEHPDVSHTVLMDTPMKGYATAFALSEPGEDKVLEFVGQFNDGPYSIDVINTGTSGDANLDGWNLVGNPYPSSLDVDATGWTKDPSYVSMGVAYWDATFGPEGGYVYYGDGVGLNGGTQFIPPMQGFFVKAIDEGGPYGVTNEARVHSDQPFYKSSLNNLLKLTVQANGYSDETAVRFIEDAELNYDGKYDFFKLFADNMPQIYSLTSNNEKLAINALPQIDEDTHITIGLKPGFNEVMSIEATNIETFNKDVPILLIDNKENVQWNLRDNPIYNFVANVNDDPDRFTLNFKGLTGIPGIDQSNINIYSYNQRIYVDAGQANSGEIIVLNIMGQELVREKLLKQLNIVSLPVSHSYVIVKVISDQGISSRKVFVD